MDIETKGYLSNLFTYMGIMDSINKKLNKLIKNNIKNSPEKNMSLFYDLVSETMRIIPYSYNEKKDVLYLKDDGILLLKNKLSYIEQDYKKILEKKSLKKSLINIYNVRNKFTHEPHNLSFGFSIGGQTSYSIGINYKDELQELSTIDLQVIVKELNLIYEKIKQEFICIVKNYDKEYRKYPIYKKTLLYKFSNYNKNITILPKYFDNYNLNNWEMENE